MSETEVSPENQRITLGEGYLSWNRGEKSTGRWGTVNLWKSNENTGSENSVRFENAPLSTYGILFAEILETAPSDYHAGLIKEELPKIGDFLVLGAGILFKESEEGVENIGVNPENEREDDWMNVRSLRRLHNQKVRLYFEIPGNHNPWGKYKPQ